MPESAIANPDMSWQSVLQSWAWPITVLLIVVAFLLWVTYSTAAKPFLVFLFGRVRRVTAFGVEFDLSEKAAIQTRTSVEAGFDEIRQNLKRQFDLLVSTEDLNNKLGVIAQAIKNLTSPAAQKSYRCTIHIPDVLFEDSLYQLLDYQPSGGGRGRTRSVRVGMIGRCARLNRADIKSDVTTQPSQLIEEWAMTIAEAASIGRDRQSFAAIPLFDDHHQLLGIFYADAKPDGAWGNLGKRKPHFHPLYNMVISEANKQGVIVALGNIMAEMRKLGPGIRIYK
jgi:hypothetical protein